MFSFKPIIHVAVIISCLIAMVLGAIHSYALTPRQKVNQSDKQVISMTEIKEKDAPSTVIDADIFHGAHKFQYGSLFLKGLVIGLVITLMIMR